MIAQAMNATRGPANSLPESAEILRLALPLMSRYKIPVTPRNYAVWYEYSSGNNRALAEKLDHLIASGAPINSGVISSLYSEYIDSNYEMSQLEKAQKIFADLYESITETLDSAVGSTSEYGATLDRFQSRIEADLSMEQLDFLLRDMAQSTEQMVQSNRNLARELEHAKREAETLKEQLQEAKQQAVTDTLTELPNRKAFFELMKQMRDSGELDSGNNCLFLVDIDHFKKVNDSYGHLFGDKVIKAIAKVLKQQIKGKDFTARIGGEEFVILLPQTDIVGAHVVAENIRQTVERSRIINPLNQQVISKVTVSIGITEIMQAEELDKVLNRADRALYCAKDRGRNRIVDASTLSLSDQELPSAMIKSYDEAC